MARLSGREARTLRGGAALIAALLFFFRAMPAYSVRLERLQEREASLRSQLDRVQSGAATRDTSRIRGLLSLRDSLSSGLFIASSAGGGASTST